MYVDRHSNDWTKYLNHSFTYAFVQEANSVAAEAWNYISVGMDAKAAQGFHHLRDTKPKLAFSRAANQAWYVCSSHNLPLPVLILP